jgi:antitoxin HigA-1
MNMNKMMRAPTTPGEILKEEFLIPLEMKQGQLAAHLHCDVKVINRIVNGRTSVTAEMALKLAAAFNTTPEFWLNAQKAVDLFKAAKKVKALPKSLMRAG